MRVTVIATGFSDANVQQTLPTMAVPTSRPAAPSRPSSAPRPTSAPAATPSRSASSNDKEFDIPEFLKRSRI